MITANDKLYYDYEYQGVKNYKEVSFRMSIKKMAEVLSACIQTHARIHSTFMLSDIKDRKLCPYDNCEAIIEVAPSLEAEWEAVAGCNLRERGIITLNYE